jgi:hypothetical protein
MTTAAQVQEMISHMGVNTVNLPGAPDIDPLKGGYVVRGGDLRSVSTPVWWPGNNLASTQTYWPHFQPWYVVWDIQGHLPNLNVRCALRDKEFWVLYDTGWVRLSYVRGPTGDPTPRVYTGFGGNATGRRESDGTWSVKIDPNGSIYHGYQGGVGVPNPAGVRAIHVRMLARKILENPSGADQRNQARYCVQMGGDLYPNASGNYDDVFRPDQNNRYWPPVASGRFIEIGNDWQPVYCTTLASAWVVETSVPRINQTITDAALRANPPPVANWLPDETSQPPVIVPTPTIQYIEPIGDSLTEGNDGVPGSYKTWRGAFQTLMSNAGITFDMIGPNFRQPDSGGTDGDCAAWGGASISAAEGAGNNITDRLPLIFAAQYQPTIITVFLGWNNRASTSAASYETLYNTIRSTRPDAKIVLCTLTPSLGNNEAGSNSADAYYADINTKVRALATANPSTTTVAECAQVAFGPGDWFDYLHYTQAGATKVAQVIYTAIVAKGWFSTTTSPPVVTPPPAGLPLVARWFDRDNGAGAYSWISNGVIGGTTASVTQDDDMQTIKVSEATAARRRIYFDCLDATDGYTPETGLTFSSGELKLSKAGAAEANHSGTVTEIGGGTYMYEATAAECNTLGILQFRVVKSGVRGFRVRVQITGIDVHDAASAGMTNLSVATSALLTTAGYTDPLTKANGVETGWTMQGALRYLLAAHAKRSGVGSSTEVYRAITDSKARITLTVDGSGNVTNVVADLT